MLCYICEDSQTTAYMKQRYCMNSDSLVIKQKQKQTNKKIYMKIKFQNSIVRLSFLCCIKDIKIAWINPCLNDKLRELLLHYFRDLRN